MSQRNENWLLVEWTAGGRDIVHVKSVLNPVIEDLKVGVVMTLNRRGEPHTATFISRARDRDQLRPKSNEEVAGPSRKSDEEPEDFSPSGGSSWAPSDEENGSCDSFQEYRKKSKLEQCRRQSTNRRSSRKILTPSHRANAVIPKIMQDAHSKKNDVSRKRAHNANSRNGSINKSLPDSTKRHNTSEVTRQTDTIDAREIAEIDNSFSVLFKMLEELKRPSAESPQPLQPHYRNNTENISQENGIVIQAMPECENPEEFENEEFNRSDDNVLITNKYDNQYKSANMPAKSKTQKNTPSTPMHGANTGQDEWVPIGSGKTLIHVERFRKVNWKSYTVATRTLLLAVFPRRVLATHSLTGKRSPAFLNKPAKMCLDPKIITDVIMEIMDRFDVKESYVRGIITTKCADECKMLKQRVKKKSSHSTSSSNLENEHPPPGIFEPTKKVPS